MPCIEAITPSCRSAGCRGVQVLRVLDAPAQVLLRVGLETASKTSSVSRLARSPMAWTQSW
jgi:hypothetical protein